MKTSGYRTDFWCLKPQIRYSILNHCCQAICTGCRLHLLCTKYYTYEVLEFILRLFVVTHFSILCSSQPLPYRMYCLGCILEVLDRVDQNWLMARYRYRGQNQSFVPRLSGGCCVEYEFRSQGAGRLYCWVY